MKQYIVNVLLRYESFASLPIGDHGDGLTLQINSTYPNNIDTIKSFVTQFLALKFNEKNSLITNILEENKFWEKYDEDISKSDGLINILVDLDCHEDISELISLIGDNSRVLRVVNDNKY
jgi:hypothetical protein